MVGDIYLGTVDAVLPGIQAAFVNIGAEKSAFLHASDLIESEDEDEPRDPDDDTDNGNGGSNGGGGERGGGGGGGGGGRRRRSGPAGGKKGRATHVKGKKKPRGAQDP